MKKLFVVLMLFAFAPCSWAATKSKSAKPKVVTAENWKPSPYPEGSQLPANYSGIDVKHFYKALSSSVGELKKGEYETTEEFEQRKAGASLGSIDPNSTYAFRMTDVHVEYDADSQTYRGKSLILCNETYDFGDSKGWVVCDAGEVSRDHDTYIGSNSFGAKTEVDRTSGVNFGLAFKKESSFFSSSFFKNEPYGIPYEVDDRFDFPIERARAYAGKDIGVLFVGRIAGASIIEGRPVLIEPKMDSPRDIFIQRYGVPFQIQKVVYYVVQTGEIIRQIDI